MKCRNVLLSLLDRREKPMTDEEAEALDEYFTRNLPGIDPGNKGGITTRPAFCMAAPGRVSGD
jgi:hypothetical protein